MPAAEAAPLTMARILIADDERVVLFTLAEGLREAGFDVIEAHDGLQALELCRSEAPDLALLDIRMPGLDGLELARRLRDETSVPFLFFSAYGDEAMVRRAVEIGALGYLIKPLLVSSIVPTVRTALARSKDISGLQGALESNRTIATAVGMLMRSEGIDRQAAFERLRQRARTQRRKLEELARTIIDQKQTPA
ncbi:ANTAR domain-containing response regulator [Sulfuritalea hydrogenivorans]|uniref:Response regulator receiver n=1 Tax=Sulfuritalea hydrogenivorans sk43H TaxID=1223802 RepID=W0SJN9_9PROT|nr:response regulator [Sulfuritalea hydrogenivorans]MDK9715485.1 response regulator [Sulfuritalea sp.]BAO30288.1 response regulator receiver [Sulfuritalea hydrogenivorans sk43H]